MDLYIVQATLLNNVADVAKNLHRKVIVMHRYACMKMWVGRMPSRSYRLVEHARVPVLVRPVGAIQKSIAEDVIINTTVTAQRIWGWTRKSLHAVLSVRTLCKANNRYRRQQNKIRALHTYILYDEDDATQQAVPLFTPQHHQPALAHSRLNNPKWDAH